MSQAISEVLPVAIGIAISPIPIIAVVYVITGAANAGTDASASDTVSWVKIGLGVLLLGLARRNWAKRPKAGETPEMPARMADVDTITPVKAFGLALLLSVVNPKNLVLTIGAAAGLGQANISTEDAVVALAVFVAVASLSVAIAVFYDLFGGASARAKLEEMKGWMSTHGNAVMAVLLLVFGVVLISKGLAPLGR